MKSMRLEYANNHNLLDTKNYSITNALVFHEGNCEKKGPITYLPIYAVDFLAK